jgi:hypothetical protein
LSSIKDPRSSEGHKARFELWMNVFVHQAFANVLNSLSSFEVSTQSVQGIMVSEVRIPLDRLVWNVKLLRALMIDVWREKDAYFDWEKQLEGIDVEEQPDEYFHRLVQMLYKRGMLKFKKPRSLGGPPAAD